MSSILDLSTWIKQPHALNVSNIETENDLSKCVVLIQKIQRAAQTLYNICNNILQNPFNEKFRRVRIRQQSSHQGGATAPPEPIQNILDVSLPVKNDSSSSSFYNWLNFLGFFPEDNDGARTKQASPPLFVVLSTAAPLSRLDQAAVSASILSDSCKKILQDFEDENIKSRLLAQERERQQEKNSQLSTLEEYRKFANQRKFVQDWVVKELVASGGLASVLSSPYHHSAIENDDDEVYNENKVSEGDLTRTEQPYSWGRQHSALVSFFEFLRYHLADSCNTDISTTSASHPVHIMFQTDEDGIKAVGTVAKMMIDDLEASLPSSDAVNRSEGLTLLRSALRQRVKFLSVKDNKDDHEILFEKMRDTNNITSSSPSSVPLLRQLLSAVIDTLEKYRYERVQKFDQLRNTFRSQIQSRDHHHQQKRVQQEQDAEGRPIYIHPELEHTALSLINDISRFIELCWCLEGARGYVAKHRVEAKRLLEGFQQGKIPVAELRRLKEEWEKKYDETKLAQGIAFFGGQNPTARGAAIVVASGPVVSAKPVAVWVSRQGTTLVHDKRGRHSSTHNRRRYGNDPLLSHKIHESHGSADAASSNSDNFYLVANTKDQTIITTAAVSDLSRGMHYDGPLSRKQHDEHFKTEKDRKTMFHGTIAEFEGAPKDATHCIRAHVPNDADAVAVVNRKTGKLHGETVSIAASDLSSSPSSSSSSSTSSSSSAARLAQPLLSRDHSNSTITRVDYRVVDIRTQPTMVILSAGYLAAEQLSFNNHVERVVQLLKNNISLQNEGMNAGPWPRYFSSFNIFTLFEPSEESGASFRKPSVLHDCPPEATNGCAERIVKNNLGCAYGTPRPRVLGCAYDDIMAVAAFAPLADIILVIVNSDTFGGSGGGRVAVINRGPDMLLTLLHQLNHAVANLGDEFSYGVDATPKVSIPNCQPDTSGWSNWVAAGAADAAPSAGCTFANLVRPTHDSCLMRRKTQRMCPVCAEALNVAFFSPTFKANGQLMALGAPRCPLRGYEIHLRATDVAELTIDHAFIARRNVSITWILPSGSSIAGTTSLTIMGSQLLMGPSSIRVTINDYSPYVSNEKRPATMSQTLEFHLNRVADWANCTITTCTTSRETTAYHCVACIQSGGCGNTWTPAGNSVVRPAVEIPEQSATNATAAIASVVLVSLFILIVGSIFACVWRRSNVVEVIVIRGNDKALFLATVFFLVVVYVVTLLIVIYGIYSLPRAPIFGEEPLIACLVLGAALCVFAAVACVGLCFESIIGLVVPGVIMSILSVPLVVLSIFTLWISYNFESAQVQDYMATAWRKKVSDGDEIICHMQNYFACSGYQQTCAMNPSKEYCLDKCGYSNHYTDPCFSQFHIFAQVWMRPAAATAIVGAFVVAACGVCAALYARSLRNASANAKNRRSYRHDPKQPVECITDEELKALRDEEFVKIAGGDDQQGVDSVEALRFVRAAFGETVEADDETEIIQAASNDGRISFERIIHIMFPYLDPSNEFRDPRTLSEDEAIETRSSDELAVAHRRKHEEYINHAGALAPERLRGLYLEHCMPNGEYKPNPQFFNIVKRVAKEHAQSVEGRMCRGLTPAELDGLRTLWARLHPDIDGDLSDQAVAAYFAVTHGGTKIRTQEHFARWKNTLDVRGRGAVGWPEFCLPFAQRALAEDARRFMIVKTQADLSVLEEEYGNLNRLLTRREVGVEYGEAYVDYVFLPGEDEVPLMRVLAAVVRGDVEMQRKMS